ncbi:MAG: hypothetical protein P4L83_00375 [Nevskia sp.]|nr:hypothetical protein [Nevskia sp.]
MEKGIRRSVQRTVILFLPFIASGCATDPERLATPSEITCINLTEPMLFTGNYPPLGYTGTGRLERGPYWSEKADEKGIFYRAPQGGISMVGTGGVPIGISDGGFYLPNDPNDHIKMYEYFSVEKVPVQAPPSDVNCSNVSLVKDPSTSKLSLVSFAAAGAAGGAAGGVIGRSIAHGSTMSYWQSAGAGAAGGLIGGVIVGAMINADVGKIATKMTSKDQKFEANLRALATARIPVKQVELSAAAAHGESPAFTPGKQSGSP